MQPDVSESAHVVVAATWTFGRGRDRRRGTAVHDREVGLEAGQLAEKLPTYGRLRWPDMIEIASADADACVDLSCIFAMIHFGIPIMTIGLVIE